MDERHRQEGRSVHNSQSRDRSQPYKVTSSQLQPQDLTDTSSSSFALNFAYAEVLEAKKDSSKVHAMYDKFLTALQADLDALESRVNSANSSQSSVSAAASNTNPPPAGTATPGGPPTTEAGATSNNSSFATQASDEKPPKSKELAERRTEYGVVWIMYMRFGRRAEGLQSSRSIFGKARKDRWTPWEVYEAAGKATRIRLP